MEGNSQINHVLVKAWVFSWTVLFLPSFPSGKCFVVLVYKLCTTQAFMKVCRDGLGAWQAAPLEGTIICACLIHPLLKSSCNCRECCQLCINILAVVGSPSCTFLKMYFKKGAGNTWSKIFPLVCTLHHKPTHLIHS